MRTVAQALFIVVSILMAVSFGLDIYQKAHSKCVINITYDQPEAGE